MDILKKEQIMVIAGDLLDSGYHCSEAMVLAVGQHYLGELDAQAVRMTTPFAGGIGCNHADLCGALTGGLMVIGGLLGRTEADVNDDHCQNVAAAYRTAFLDSFGWVVCQDLKDNWRAKQGLASCRKLEEMAAALLIDVIENAD